MTSASRTPTVFASVVFATLFAGEAIRNAIGWWGFAAWALLLAALSIVVLVRGRGARVAQTLTWRRVLIRPSTFLAAFLVWALVSIIWSAYALGTLLGLAILAATTVAPFAIARLGRGDPLLVLRSLAFALGAILALSIVFELFVAVVVRTPVLPTFPIDVVPGEKIPDAFYWSRGLLLEGGRIQGIVGNANLLGFIALLASVVGLGAARHGGRLRAVGIATAVLGVATLALTRSSTVLAAAIAVVVVALLVLCFRRSGRYPRERRVAGWIVVAALAAAMVAAVVFAEPLLEAIGKSPDLTGRSDIWAAVTGLFIERPVAGWGWIGYWQPWIPLFDGLAVRRGVEYLQAHDAFLDVAFQLGVVGLIFFVALIVTTAIRAVRSTRVTLLPVLLLTALLVQAVAESRLLLEGNWALLVLLALGAVTSSAADYVTKTAVPRTPEEHAAQP